MLVTENMFGPPSIKHLPTPMTVRTYITHFTGLVRVIVDQLLPDMYQNYRTAQILTGENIDEFDEFPAIRQYFPYQNFPFS